MEDVRWENKRGIDRIIESGSDEKDTRRKD